LHGQYWGAKKPSRTKASELSLKFSYMAGGLLPKKS
jgi:hypothetical protein